MDTKEHVKWSLIVPAILAITLSGCASKKQSTVDDGTLAMAKNMTYDLDGTSVRHESPGTAPIWTCPMHPRVRQSVPGTCSVCGMELVRTDTASTATERSSHADHATSTHSSGTHGGGSCCH